ncbi:MAG: hypothetical protein VKK04_25790 [Synechococcales bacterium]|nr:hypothetical protein [Synechococcales bacterium]
MFPTPTPDLIDGLIVVVAISLASSIFCPLFCWVLSWGYRTPARLER